MKKICFITVLVLCLFGMILFSCESSKSKTTTVETTEQPAVPTKDDEEFSRSTQDVKITREEFSADKLAIFNIIKTLSTIMEKSDYNAWLKYIDPESIEYWSQQKNLVQAAKRLPNKRRLANLNDYFKYVFIPSRKDRQINEIRYISLDSVKAVQMQDEQDIVYYNFVKLNNNWMVKIPPLSHQQ